MDTRADCLKPGMGRPVAVKRIMESSSSSSTVVTFAGAEIRGSKSES